MLVSFLHQNNDEKFFERERNMKYCELAEIYMWCRHLTRIFPRHLQNKPNKNAIMSTSAADISKLEEVVAFWATIDKKKKFTKDPEFDFLLINKYADLHSDLMAGVYDSLLESSPMPGLLGAVLVLDQFSRNMFRGSAKSFASDAKALSLAKQAMDNGSYQEAGDSKEWFYLPFMHSEEMSDQKLCVQYFTSSSWVSC
jgi:uncharacterized protein (DUF924 family)